MQNVNAAVAPVAGYENFTVAGKKDDGISVGVVAGVLCGVLGGVAAHANGASVGASVVGAVAGAVAGYAAGNAVAVIEINTTGKILGGCVSGAFGASMGMLGAQLTDGLGKVAGL